jgi:hypothetical protein
LALLALLYSSYTSETSLELSVTEVANGVMIQNVGNVDCLAFVNIAKGEEYFELAAARNVTVTDIPQPIEVSIVRL